jgi:hypothetical protein
VDEEWRVSLITCVQLASGKPVLADSVCDLLRSRAGEDISVTAGKAGVFLYAATADAAATAEGMAREVLAQQGLVADIRLDRWDPSRQAWLPPSDAAAAEPPSGQEHDPGHRRLGAVGAVVTAIFDGLGNTGFLSPGQPRRLLGARWPSPGP